MKRTIINNRTERQRKNDRDAMKLALLFLCIWLLSGDGWMELLWALVQKLMP